MFCLQKTRVGRVRNGIRGDSEATVARSLPVKIARIVRMLCDSKVMYWYCGFGSVWGGY